MRLSVIVLAVVAMLVAAVQAHLPLDPHLVASAIRIGRLEDEIEELEHEIQQAAKIDPYGFIIEMHRRLNEVEGKSVSRKFHRKKEKNTQIKNTPEININF